MISKHLFLTSVFIITLLSSCRHHTRNHNAQEETAEELNSEKGQDNESETILYEQAESDDSAEELSSDNSDEQTYVDRSQSQNIDDGEHEAKVEYYNSNTGTYSTYTLPVDVEDGKVTSIHFTNGGELADHHYIGSAELENGEADIIDDRGYEYHVTIDE